MMSSADESEVRLGDVRPTSPDPKPLRGPALNGADGAPVWADPDWVCEGAEEVFRGRWSERSDWNIPGPFYAAKPGPGVFGESLCPRAVGIDPDRKPCVFRQPVTADDVTAMREAASRDSDRSFGCDGNEHWDVDTVREWWRSHQEWKAHVYNRLGTRAWWGTDCQKERAAFYPVVEQWKRSLGTFEVYLRQYMYFLQTGRWPATRAALPNL